MTWTGRGRTRASGAQLPNNWKQIRQRILARDSYTCTLIIGSQRCLNVGTDVDHIGDPHDHTDANLRTLCKKHHAQRSAKQGSDAAKAITAQRYRPTPRHPGLK